MTSSGAGLQPLFCQELEQFVGTSDRVRVQPNNEVALHHPDELLKLLTEERLEPRTARSHPQIACSALLLFWIHGS